MNKHFYLKLAASNLKKNSRTYLPYIFACIFCVAMFYIIHMMSASQYFLHDSLGQILGFGNIVIGIFSVIFLFYTNSFLIKRRKMEFGLFNVLGMDKRHIAKVISLETLFSSTISLVLGLGVGILFSKLVYLILSNIINFKLHDQVVVSMESIMVTLLLFLGVFAITLLNSLRLIHLSKPIELLKGGQTGEREPKIKWILTILGVASLGAGYYLAITIKDPLDALLYFFVAVVFVIIGTYCLFTSVSIFVLKLLKKNKNYYYKTSHFISISGMMYRMKQNAVGLANICILSTIVLVTISTTVSLYAGFDDIMNQRFSRDITVRAQSANNTEKNTDDLNNAVHNELEKSKYTISNKANIKSYSTMVLINDKGFSFEGYLNLVMTGKQCGLTVIPLDDYNKITGDNWELNHKEILVYTNRSALKRKTISIGDEEYSVKKSAGTREGSAKAKELSGYFGNVAIETCYIIVKDIDEVKDIMNTAVNELKGIVEKDELETFKTITVDVAFDVDASREDQAKLSEDLEDTLQNGFDKNNDLYGIRTESRAAQESDFLNSYGGLLFLGMYLGIMFLMATVLIIYYKQLSEGYDDKERFRIMQNVGLTKKEVRKAIRSQVLTMFFMPLIVACIHITFAFPMISKLLMLFNMDNAKLFMLCMLSCAAVFAVFYVIVYAITSRLYYKIVEES